AGPGSSGWRRGSTDTMARDRRSGISRSDKHRAVGALASRAWGLSGHGSSSRTRRRRGPKRARRIGRLGAGVEDSSYGSLATQYSSNPQNDHPRQIEPTEPIPMAGVKGALRENVHRDLRGEDPRLAEIEPGQHAVIRVGHPRD